MRLTTIFVPEIISLFVFPSLRLLRASSDRSLVSIYILIGGVVMVPLLLVVWTFGSFLINAPIHLISILIPHFVLYINLDPIDMNGLERSLWSTDHPRTWFEGFFWMKDINIIIFFKVIINYIESIRVFSNTSWFRCPSSLSPSDTEFKVLIWSSSIL